MITPRTTSSPLALSLLALLLCTGSDAKEQKKAKDTPSQPTGPTPGLVGPSPGLISHTFPITVGQALPVDKSKNPEIVHIRRIDIPAESLTWTHPGKRPVVGDDFHVRISEDRVIKIEIKSVAITSRGIEMSGSFNGGLGSAQILFIDQKVSIVVQDHKEQKSYIISYNFKDHSYTLREIDITKLPQGIH